MTQTLEEITQDAIDELRERAEDGGILRMNEPDYDGALAEIADSSVPVYTSDLMELAANNLDLATNMPECGPAFDGEPTPANIVAANIYEHVTQALWDEWDTIKEEIKEKQEEADEIGEAIDALAEALS